MNAAQLSRRGFLASAASAAGVSWLATYWPAVLAAGKEARAAKGAGAAFEVLSADEAADLAAIAAQIIPTDETPGATEAGVVYFIDKVLKGFMAGAAPGLRDGLKALNAKAAGGRFSALTADQQHTLLEGEEKSAFFGTMQFLTVAGMFSMPSRGGNRNDVGWKMLGFEHQMAWQPPFGYYDAKATGKPWSES